MGSSVFATALAVAAGAVAVSAQSSFGPITSIPGLAFQPTYKMYGGYVNYTSPLLKSTHYTYHWIVESAGNPATDPIAFWTNGGPGCSGLFGMGYENGPFLILPNNTLIPNDYSWNKFATMVYFEQPAGVGFSYSSDPLDYLAYNDDISQTDNLAFMTAFFKQYPKYANNALWLTSESYGGNYVPQLARQILTGSDTRLASQLRQGGIVVGNPVFSADNATFSDIMNVVQANILYGHASLPLSFMNKYNSAGCNSLQQPANCADLNQEMFSLAGACFQVNQCGDDIYADPTGNATLGPLTTANGWDRDQLWENYLNSPSVWTAIHAQQPALKTWADCANIGYDMTWPSNIPDYTALFNNKVKTLIMSGDVDVATCPFAGTQIGLSYLNRTVTKHWRPWVVNTAGGNGQQAGYIEEYDTYTFATVKAGGHEAPGFQPLASYHLVSGFITGTGVQEQNVKQFTGPARRSQGSILREAVRKSQALARGA